MGKIIVGYEFPDEKLYDEAMREMKYINELKTNENFKEITFKLELYNTLVEEAAFKTPLGFEFLRELQKALSKSNVINRDDIKPIPYVAVSTKTTVKEIEKPKTQIGNKTTNAQNEGIYHDKYVKAMIVNAVLIVMIIVMFAMNKYSKKFDADYYRESIENDYISWEKNLSERESSINVREASNTENQTTEASNTETQTVASE